MEDTKFTITKSTITSYKIRSNEFAWADINIDAGEKQGRIQIASDYGNWQNYWGACGCPFNEFLAGLNIDYFAGKVGADKWFDLEKTLEYLNDRILDKDNEDLRTDEELEELLDEFKYLKDVSGKEEFIHVVQNCDKIMEMEGYSPNMYYAIEPGFKRFWEEIWPIFLEEIKK